MDNDQKQSSTPALTVLIVTVVLIVGVLGFVVLSGDEDDNGAAPSGQSSASVDENRVRAELLACELDTKALKTAIVTWNTEYLSGGNPTDYTTPYPPSEQALTEDRTRMLMEESDRHDLTGGGSSIPMIVKVSGKCDAETIVQLT